ncbi:MAG TPA: hypothetical protein VN540_02895 [Clostridia bacterium]|nr:hypothetical protein [Clostridia bacterium]
MKADKKFELAVYAVLLLIGVLIFAVSSCDGFAFNKASGNAAQENTSSADEVEKRLEDILSSIEGAGEVKVMIVRAEDGSVQGAIVTAEGAEDIAVCEKLRNAVRTVLGIQIGQVEIFQMQINQAEG